jgi:hypothetical protein
MENQHRKGLPIAWFDWLAERAYAISKNVVQSGITLESIRMI